MSSQVKTEINSKLPDVGTTIFSVMTKMANEYGAINISQGFPDFPIDRVLIELVHKYMIKGFNQYAPMPGVFRLRERISEKHHSLYHSYYDPETEITITAGATQSIYTAISALIHAGDEVIVIEPAYDSYAPAIRLHKGIPVFSRLEPPEYKINWKDIRLKITDRTKLIMINSPHNPTGTIIDGDDLDHLEELALYYDLFVISDEVYEHLVFDGQKHESVAKRSALRDRSFLVYSFGKVFHATGWRTGYCLGPENLMAEFRKAHQFQTYSCNTPMQHAYAEYLENEDHYLYLNEFFERKRDLLINALKPSRLKLIPSAGTYFQLADYSQISEEGDREFSERVTKEHGVASIPISVFYHDQYDQRIIRLCFAKNDEVLEKAAEKLCRL